MKAVREMWSSHGRQFKASGNVKINWKNGRLIGRMVESWHGSKKVKRVRVAHMLKVSKHVFLIALGIKDISEIVLLCC